MSNGGEKNELFHYHDLLSKGVMESKKLSFLFSKLELKK